MCHGVAADSLQMLIEPLGHSPDPVAQVLRLDEVMALVFVHDQFRFYPQRLQRVPEFVGLRPAILPVAIPHKEQFTARNFSPPCPALP